MTDRRSYDPFAPPPARSDEDDVWPDLDEVEPPEDGDGQAGDAPADLIPEDLDDITLKDLKALAELADVPTYGTKAELAARIRAAHQ